MIIHADILIWAEQYQGEPFHAVLCDPPYGLNESELDIGAVLADWMADREHQPKGAGFMGREWDAFLPGPRIWRAIRAVCHPGAYLFAFGGTRTADLLGLALRMAGWEKIDEIDWCYGSGFPKNHNISKAIDRAAKADRPVVIQRKHRPKFDAAGFEYRKKDNGFNSKDRATFDVTAAATPLAEAWSGYGTALKPAHEPILVFRNPFKGTYAQNCTKHGAGALNIDGGRVGTDEDTARNRAPVRGAVGFGRGVEGMGGDGHPAGRWPSNLILQHSIDCRPIGARRVRGITGGGRVEAEGWGWAQGGDRPRHADADGYETVAAWECAPGCAVAALGRQSGETGNGYRQNPSFADSTDSVTGWNHGPRGERGHDDTGTAARFFFQSDYLLDRLEETDPVIYKAKASRSEREAGLDPRQIALIGREEQSESTINDGRQKPIDNPYQRGETTRRNIGPCIKPLSLTRYLATLLLPPALYAPRRILVPFCGTGSEAAGALLAGWDEVVGVEREQDYHRIAEARIAYWKQRRHELGDPSKEIRAELSDVPDGQLDMFA